jgi:hypothetical protein
MANSPEDPVSGSEFTIGHLDKVDDNGMEHWCYINPNAKRQSQIVN